MNELINIIPNPDPLPVAAGWFQFLSYLTYFLHLLAVGIMFGTAVSMALGYFKGKTDDQWKPFAGRMSKVLPFTIAFAVNLGVAPLLFLQVLYGNFFYTASVLMGIPWLLIVVVLIIGYYCAYWLVFKGAAPPAGKGSGSNLKRKSLISLIISLILAWVGFLLVNVNTLMMTPHRWESYYDHMNGMFLNVSEGTLFPRYIFYLFLFLAIGGMFISLFYKIKDKFEESERGFHFGSALSGYFAFLSVPAFALFLLMLPREINSVFLGGNGLWTVSAFIFVLGLFATAFLGFKRKTVPASLVFVVDLIVFVLVRNHIRQLYLEPFKEKFPTLAQNTQYGVMVLFFVILAAGLGLVAWILIKVAKEKK